MASQEAVERRRAIRRLRAMEKARRREQQAKRDAEAEDPWRNIRRRSIPPQRKHPLHDDPLYWQARRCEWDALSEDFLPVLSAAGGVKVFGEPTLSSFWRWWTQQLDYQQRRVLVNLSRALHTPAAREVGDGDEDHYGQREQLRRRYGGVEQVR